MQLSCCPTNSPPLSNMIQFCEHCHRHYDDADQWTICPHSPLGYAHDDLCPKCDTLRSVHGPCRHQLAVASPAEILPTTTELAAIKQWATTSPAACRPPLRYTGVDHLSDPGT